jgi:hypothetical protein
VVCVDQHACLPAWQPLDSQRAGKAHERAVETVTGNQLGAVSRVLARQIDHIRTLAREIQNGQAVLVSHERELTTLGKRLYKRLSPNVLVYIDLHQISDPVCGE